MFKNDTQVIHHLVSKQDQNAGLMSTIEPLNSISLFSKNADQSQSQMHFLLQDQQRLEPGFAQQFEIRNEVEPLL